MRSKLLACAMVLLVPGAALGSESTAPPNGSSAIDDTAAAAYRERPYAFCKDPKFLVGERRETACALATEIEDCEALAKLCANPRAEPTHEGLSTLLDVLAPVGRALLYVIVAAILLAVALPVLRALARVRRWRRTSTTAAPKPLSAPQEEAGAETPSDVLSLADELSDRGDLARALRLYLRAALTALDRRGAIRLGRHRTNGEYVRECRDPSSKAELSKLVGDVERVEFGGAPPSADLVRGVRARARQLVQAAAVVGALVSLLGCKALSAPLSDPTGDELALDVFERNGFTVKPLDTSLATLPVSDETHDYVLLVDAERVPLEAEARAHLLRWVEEGGALVLLGNAPSWPSELGARHETASTRDLSISAQSLNHSQDLRGRVARADSLVLAKTSLSFDRAKLGERTYATKLWVGSGLVLAIANDDLMTNVAMRVPGNPTALVTLLRDFAPELSEIRVAKSEDGVPPPSNPMAALIAAGLGKGVWHALAAACLLFFAYGARHARARSAEIPTRREYREHVTAVGGLYARAHADAHALSRYGRFFLLRAHELAPRGSDPLAHLATQANVPLTHVRELVARAESADDVRRGDERALIRELKDLLTPRRAGPHDRRPP